MIRNFGYLHVFAFSAIACGACPVFAQTTNVRPNIGILEHPIEDVWITKARVVVKPGEIIEDGVLSIVDGKVEQVGKGLEPPAGARVIELPGRTIYPGFIDLGIDVEMPAVDAALGTPHWNPNVTPERSVAKLANVAADAFSKLRKSGVTAALVAPRDGIIKGTSSVILTGEKRLAESIVKPDVALHVRLTVARGRGRDSYPGSPMGAVALARQSFLDAQWYENAWAAYRAATGLPKPERDSALEAIANHSAAGKLVVFDALNEQYALRADAFANEFGLRALLRGSGQEYQLLEPIARTGRAIVLPVNFPKPPKVNSIEAAIDTELEELMHWELAPENPGRVAKASIPFSLTTAGLSDPNEFVPQIRKAIQRGLDPNTALAALTTTPAGLLELSQQIGTLSPGSWANLVVASGDLWDEKTKIEEVWVQGQRPDGAFKNDADIDGNWNLVAVEVRNAPSQPKAWPSHLELELKDSQKKITASLVLEKKDPSDPSDPTDPSDQKKKDPTKIKLTNARWGDGTFSGQFNVKSVLNETTGVASIGLSLLPGSGSEPVCIGSVVWPDGTEHSVRATRKPATTPSVPDPSDAKPDEAKTEETNSDDEKSEKKPDQEKKEPAAVLSTLRYPFASFGRTGIPEQPPCVVIQNTSLWTCGPAGILREADMIVRSGIIEAIGIDLQVPEGATVIDGSRFEVSPGLIDCHSHMATDSGVNEATQAVTAEVRIGDFINAEDITIYRQLAGGLTTANVLHGSANPIGGQNQVVKLRWGAAYEELKFKDAPAGIKFALGENVKQSNWQDSDGTRYPQSRMGVEQLLRDRFNSALEYDREWQAWSQNSKGLPPRRDLESEAIAEILKGKRWIHCHSYRQDEILALLRLLEEYKVKIGSLQHILEGYKVADAIAEHGATASTFSDWWAFKLEVFDAIPFNGAVMHRKGVSVSFNSDDAELGRHMNHEAAKAVKYGGVDPHEALKFVTLNPAVQLRIDSYVGSLEPGKHADFVLWSGSPLSLRSRSEQTWIDGRKYFDRQLDAEVRVRDAELHRRLVQKVLESGESAGEKSSLAEDPSRLWPNHDEFCHHHHDESEHHEHANQEEQQHDR